MHNLICCKKLVLRTFIRGRVPEWPKGADCKSVIYDFDGSNPSPPTNKALYIRDYAVCGVLFMSLSSPLARYRPSFLYTTSSISATRSLPSPSARCRPSFLYSCITSIDRTNYCVIPYHGKKNS